jgi:hypothetical protein
MAAVAGAHLGTIGGILLATVLNNGGGAWDNAKKFIEAGGLQDEHGVVLGKGSEPHKAAVVGDTIGDPFKDTAGPSLHVLIKLLATITLVLAPLFIKSASPDDERPRTEPCAVSCDLRLNQANLRRLIRLVSAGDPTSRRSISFQDCSQAAVEPWSRHLSTHDLAQAEVEASAVSEHIRRAFWRRPPRRHLALTSVAPPRPAALPRRASTSSRFG